MTSLDDERDARPQTTYEKILSWVIRKLDTHLENVGKAAWERKDHKDRRDVW